MGFLPADSERIRADRLAIAISETSVDSARARAAGRANCRDGSRILARRHFLARFRNIRFRPHSRIETAHRYLFARVGNQAWRPTCNLRSEDFCQSGARSRAAARRILVIAPRTPKAT